MGVAWGLAGVVPGANQRRVYCFLALPQRARIVFFKPWRLDFSRRGVSSTGRPFSTHACLLAGFVLDKVRHGDVPARFAEAFVDVVKREVAERVQSERGRVVVVGGGGEVAPALALDAASLAAPVRS